MASRIYVTPFPVITSGNMASNITSLPTIIQRVSMVSYSVTWTGSSPVGALSVQVSNDYTENAAGGVANSGTWNTLTLNVGGTPATSIPISGNTGNGFIDIEDTAAYAIQLVYTATSGSGTLSAIITGKVK